MKHCLFIVALNITLLSILSCSTGNKLSPVGLVPANSTIVLSTRWQEVCRDQKLKSLLKADRLESTLAPLGVESTEITRLALFNNGFDSGSSNFGIILSGSYKVATVINNLQSHGWQKQSYKGLAIYRDLSGNQFLSILKESLLVIGAREAIESTIDILLNQANGFVRQKNLNQMIRESSYPITIILAMSQETEDMNNVLIHTTSFLLDIFEMGSLGELLKNIGFARVLSCSISRQGANYPVEIRAVMKDENSAGLISGSLNLLKGTSKLIPREGMSASDRETINRFQDLQITRKGETISIKMSIPEREMFR